MDSRLPGKQQALFLLFMLLHFAVPYLFLCIGKFCSLFLTFISWIPSVTVPCVLSQLQVVWSFFFSFFPSVVALTLPQPPTAGTPPRATLDVLPPWQRCHETPVVIRVMDWVNNIAPAPPHQLYCTSDCTSSHRHLCTAAANNLPQLSGRTNNPTV